MPQRPHNAANVRSVELGASHIDHTHTHVSTTGKTANDHHNEIHAANHSDGGADEVSVENLATASTDVSTSLKPDGLGGVEFVDTTHDDLAGVTADQHHAQNHAAQHAENAADELDAGALGSGASADGTVLTSDGVGGGAWEAASAHGGHVTNGDSHDHVGGDGAQIDHGGLAGRADDDHTQYLTDARHINRHSNGRWERGGTDQTIASSTPTDMIVNTLISEEDPNNDFTMNTSTGILTFNNAGLYVVTAGVNWVNTVGGGAQNQLRLTRNDTQIIAMIRYVPLANAEANIVAVFSFAATNTIKAVVFHTEGTDQTVTANARTYLTVHRIT